MALHWEESYKLGIPTIDEQHEAMFDNFIELSNAINDGLQQEKAEKMLDYLSEYVDTHFAEEEHLMKRFHYPGLEEQRQQHANFRERVSELIDMMTDRVPAKEIAIRIDAIIVRYLINHIRKVDTKLIDFLKISKVGEENVVNM